MGMTLGTFHTHGPLLTDPWNLHTIKVSLFLNQRVRGWVTVLPIDLARISSPGASFSNIALIGSAVTGAASMQGVLPGSQANSLTGISQHLQVQGPLLFPFPGGTGYRQVKSSDW